MRSGKTGALWSAQDEEHLLQFVRSGATPIRAAAYLKRSIVSVKSRARRIGAPFLPDRATKKRRLLRYEAAKTQALSWR